MEINPWLLIGADDTVTIRVAQSEMGQGTFTGLAQLVADELDADWKFVRAEYVSLTNAGRQHVAERLTASRRDVNRGGPDGTSV